MILTDVNDVNNMYVSECLLTDSGHYLLPTDDPQGAKQQEPQIALTCDDALMTLAKSLAAIANENMTTTTQEYVNRKSSL